MYRLSWIAVNDYINRGIPAIIPVPGSHGLSVVVDSDSSRLALRIPTVGAIALEPSPYKDIYFDMRRLGASDVFELSTRQSGLFFSFFLFAMSIVEHIEESNLECKEAVKKSLHEFGMLLVQRSLISESACVGLLGELWLLEELIAKRGEQLFNSWLGPLGERHDFRFGEYEIEVKSTTKRKRIHTINGLDQLEPSPGKILFILSIRLERAGHGSGLSLSNRIDGIRSLLASSSHLLESFETHLGRLGYRNEDAPFYNEAYSFRDKCSLIPVDRNCPSLTREKLQLLEGGPLAERIVEAEYGINLEGLGQFEGSPEFEQILPGIRAMGGD